MCYNICIRNTENMNDWRKIMNGISTEHFCDDMLLSNHQVTVNRVYKGLKRVLKEKGYAVMYINGCSHYIKPLSENSMGFGSGKLEITFYDDDNEAEIKSKLSKYFSSYSSVIGYGGRDYTKIEKERIEKMCSW